MFKKKEIKKPDIRSVRKYQSVISEIKKELNKIIVGQNEVIDYLIISLLANGHTLVEGVPGTAKTLIIRALAKITGCKYSRIQFTIDLLPTDILGLTIYTKDGGFKTEKGPIFANFIIADEINRATPKCQSALLEAMQEKQVTIGKVTYKLPNPFFVMATQNPIESEGVYRLPEAQIDRLLLKVFITYPKEKEEQEVLKKNINLRLFEDYDLKSITSPKEIIEMQEFVKKIYIAPELEEYIVRLVNSTRFDGFALSKYIEYGASPRASIGLFIASKAHALISGNNFVSPHDIKKIAYPILRHRLILNYEAQAENIKPDEIIKEALLKVPIP